MKLNQLQSKVRKSKPFVKTTDLEISTILEDGKIAGFSAVFNGYGREFKAKDNPKKAFEEMEKYLNKMCPTE